MSYITTVTGKHFFPLNPNQHDIDIRDIAHALSLICRANGHFKHFYSVAQHSIACAAEACARGCSLEVTLGCLLHDASEAYLCDVTRPVKKHIPAYLQAEENLQSVIWERFIGRELTEAEKQQIFEIDDHILSMEFHLLMPEDLNEDYRKLQSDCLCEYQDSQEVKAQFIGLQRILHFEIAMREAEHLLRTGETPDRLQRLINELESYYTSAEWKRDLEADEAGLLPEKLKRGVLSEDGVDHLLSAYIEKADADPQNGKAEIIKDAKAKSFKGKYNHLLFGGIIL